MEGRWVATGGILSQLASCWGSEGAYSDDLARTLTAGLTLVIIATAASSFYLTWRKKAEQRLPALPPGPRGLPILGSLPFLGRNTQRYFADLAKMYGPVMSIRLGTKLTVIVSSPAAAKEVFKDHDAVLAYRDVTAAASVMSYGKRDIGWNSDPASWRLLRKLTVKEMLNSSSLNKFCSLRRSEVHRMVKEVYRRRGTPVQVRKSLFLTLLDVTANMLWGNAVVGEERSRVGEELREVTNEINKIMVEPNVSDFIPALAPFDLQGVERRMKRMRDRWDNIISKIMNMRPTDAGNGNGAEGRRRSSGSGDRDFLQAMLDALESNANLTFDHIKAVLLDMFLGGVDTSTSAIEWAMAEMMHNPDKLRKAQEELDRVVGRDAVAEESHLPQLRYLDAVVKETLRLHPVIPLMVPRCASVACVIGGHLIPEGTKVFVNSWAIHRDPSIWEDPLEFRPERFLVEETKWDYNGGGGFQFLPFGFGRRICVGISMAERMLGFVLAMLLHSFDWNLPAGEEVNLTEALGFTLKMETPLSVIPTPRSTNLQQYM